MAHPAPISRDDTKPFACTLCVQRKVKCDKHQPCLSCRKSQLQCSYRATPPPQRRKRKIDNSSQILLDKLQSHETILRSAGLLFETFDDSNEGVNDHDGGGDEAIDNRLGLSLPAEPTDSRVTMQAPPPRPGVLVSEYGGKRYYEHGMIGSLGQEVCTKSL